MERLTILLADGTVCYADENITLVPAELSVGQIRRILHQLNKYETTGLTPNEITTLKKSANTKAKCQRKGIVAIPKNRKSINAIYIKRLNSINEVVKFLAENNAFTLRDGKLIIIGENIPKSQLSPCNLKTKMVLRIKNACE